MNPSWEGLCDMLEGEGQTVAEIAIRLRGGLTVSGRMSVETARALFRDPAAPGNSFDGDPVVRLSDFTPAGLPGR
ncbi:MAG: hypothetical protein ABIK89_16310 [Planctomycetota bacterium]